MYKKLCMVNFIMYIAKLICVGSNTNNSSKIIIELKLELD